MQGPTSGGLESHVRVRFLFLSVLKFKKAAPTTRIFKSMIWPKTIMRQHIRSIAKNIAYVTFSPFWGATLLPLTPLTHADDADRPPRPDAACSRDLLFFSATPLTLTPLTLTPLTLTPLTPPPGRVQP